MPVLNEPANHIVHQIEELINKGRFFEGHNLAEKTLTEVPDSLRIKQLLGLSLAKLGLTEKARVFLESLHQEYPDNEEVAGILGRVYKDQFKATGNIELARLSRDIYRKNFQKSESYYTGVNAATMSMICKEDKLAQEIARHVIQVTIKEPEDFWSLATLGEASLLINDLPQSLDYFQKAHQRSMDNLGMVQSVYAQLVLIKQYLQVPQELFRLFHPPGIVAFAGHMIDRPSQTDPRFPPSIETPVREAIKEALDRLDAKIGYCSLACGSDILFGEAILGRGGELTVYLPFNKEDFIRSSVGFAGEEWIRRFNQILEKVEVKYVTEEKFLGTEDLFTFMNQVIIGNSLLRGRLMYTQPYFLGVLSQNSGKVKIGGTQEITNMWPLKERMVIIDPNIFEFDRDRKNPNIENKTSSLEKKQIENFQVDRELRFILFADLVGFSKMEEEQTPYFMAVLLKSIAQHFKSLKTKPEILNTWGDSFFAVYQTAQDAVDFAFLLKEIIEEVMEQQDFPIDTNIRIALHGGPVFLGKDPLTHRKNAYGTHINRTARMEPVTQPGCIYASEQFAATLIFETGSKYQYDYVGKIHLPKDFGVQEMYQIKITGLANG